MIKFIKKIESIIYIFIFSAFLVLPHQVLALTILGIPLEDPPGVGDVKKLLDGIFALSLKVAAVVAVFFVFYGGAQYIIGSISGKETGKDTIRQALTGFVIALFAGAIIALLKAILFAIK